MSLLPTLADLSPARLTNPDSAELPLVINCGKYAGSGQFFEPHTSGTLRWLQYSVDRDNGVPVLGRSQSLRRLLAARQAARAAVAQDAQVVVSHGPHLSFAVQHFLEEFGYRGPHVAFAFNYASLPGAAKRALHRRGFKGIDRFVVYSRMERQLYHDVFGIPLDRLEFLYWGVNPPKIDPADGPLVDGPYVSAIGGNSRDYGCFVDAMRRLPHVKAVIVVRPENLAGLSLLSNVTTMTNIPLGQAMNVLAYSRFMALPLAGAEIPCGHVTIVAAMFLSRAIIATQSAGIEDYLSPEKNALLVEAENAEQMAAGIDRLWKDSSLADRLGKAGKTFAETNCTEANTLSALLRIFEALGVKVEQGG